MMVEVSLWQLASLLLSFFAFVGGACKVLLTQIDKRLDARFEAMELSKKQATEVWNTQFEKLLKHDQEEMRQRQELERQLLTLKGELPLHYVLRADYIRNQTVIEAKLDAVALKIENLQLRKPE
ncbi:MAG: hypothetical protein LBK01_04480 [Burkholderiaceae bacterium]|jgi:hypothetical protein|nr:hypothetical protein [Burkholderiaceae bacterium]